MTRVPAITPGISTAIAALAVVTWAYWRTFADIADRWIGDPQYQHGFLVPLFSCYLLWKRRERLEFGTLEPRWWGVGIIAMAGCLRLMSHYFYQPWLDTGSLLICLAGVAAAFGGRRCLAWSGPSILFLAFMLPLPYRFQVALGATLQSIATVLSTYAIQTLGVSAVSEGNLILLTDTKLGVEEACNGLSMLITFFALSTAVAIVVHRSTVEKVAIVASAVPIAILSNVARITITGLLAEASNADWAKSFVHDFAGLLMMPLALGMLLVEMFVLARSFEIEYLVRYNPALEESAAV